MDGQSRLQILGWFREVEEIKAEYAKTKNAKKEPTTDDLIKFVEKSKK